MQSGKTKFSDYLFVVLWETRRFKLKLIINLEGVIALISVPVRIKKTPQCGFILTSKNNDVKKQFIMANIMLNEC